MRERQPVLLTADHMRRIHACFSPVPRARSLSPDKMALSGDGETTGGGRSRGAACLPAQLAPIPSSMLPEIPAGRHSSLGIAAPGWGEGSESPGGRACAVRDPLSPSSLLPMDRYDSHDVRQLRCSLVLPACRNASQPSASCHLVPMPGAWDRRVGVRPDI